MFVVPPSAVTMQSFYWGAQPPRLLFGAPPAEREGRTDTLNGEPVSSAFVSREARLTAPRRARSLAQLHRYGFRRFGVFFVPDRLNAELQTHSSNFAQQGIWTRPPGIVHP